MGLDMYLRGDKFKRTEFKRLPDGELERNEDGSIIPINVRMIDGFECESERLKLGYWRKHAPLHKLIVDTFADGVDECQVIHLSSEDCRLIAHKLRRRDFPEDVSGFFFGDDDWWKECCDAADDDADLFERVADWNDLDSQGDVYWHSVEYQASW
tara:strand:- start:1394 stop:1858 length:465 start_codon:yes stop_codon:yes gene_type:complete